MKTHPMLFNGEMVKALLAGNKVQTRRPMKDQPEEIPGSNGDYWFASHKCQQMVRISHLKEVISKDFSFINCVSPWEIGDLIYVRETWFQYGHHSMPGYPDAEPEDAVFIGEKKALFMTDEIPESGRYFGEMFWRKRPSIHMPRWASRLTLKVTGVRIEQVKDLSREDAKQEGFSCRTAFMNTWQECYGGSWRSNHWVWVIDFEVIQQNVDHYLAAQENAA